MRLYSSYGLYSPSLTVSWLDINRILFQQNPHFYLETTSVNKTAKVVTKGFLRIKSLWCVAAYTLLQQNKFVLKHITKFNLNTKQSRMFLFCFVGGFFLQIFACSFFSQTLNFNSKWISFANYTFVQQKYLIIILVNSFCLFWTSSLFLKYKISELMSSILAAYTQLWERKLNYYFWLHLQSFYSNGVEQSTETI